MKEIKIILKLILFQEYTRAKTKCHVSESQARVKLRV